MDKHVIDSCAILALLIYIAFLAGAPDQADLTRRALAPPRVIYLRHQTGKTAVTFDCLTARHRRATRKGEVNQDA